ncbi:uncharacterized protein NECHADRAFT_52172 [Fusarium vanettenii 77-13-4]|uniref:Protein kinase domain-containing protein n=1 Tax=Fusarium vanettenii (strain ATCC MYA-4622 / CBS 123669 / FGSC 9596 / NRRL 45880 / 77-13-4) TaxID=660122 RepID=C7ZG21_FUSV7|nr:uncharacterized protein NECHADRAFT_52172 [Fusarium vanettenii 77-13-4]EEU36982.1 hypothetical protein NECHADRAFT_52172 [Fusarium vanettenii 77-13-4]
MDNEPIGHFREWAHKSQKPGVNGKKEECPYVPPLLLKTYWTPERVKEVVESFSFHVPVAEITERFLCVFSILVYIGQPDKISLFISKNYDNFNLPFTELPPEMSPSLQEFVDQQWMFCPLEFSDSLMYKRDLPTRRILPVTYLESLRDKAWRGDGPSIRKVHVHPECNNTANKDTHVVFKIYKGSGLKSLYKAEADFYSRLSEMHKAQKNITQHYGSFSFEETETRIIILEYAAMGSLLDFFRNLPPVTPDEFLMFWRELLKLVPALHAVQNLDRSPLEGSSTAVHQDIQPANILVFPHPPKSPPRDKSRFDVRFKLADFGLAELRRVSKPDEQFTIDNEGNCMYGAPECYPNYAIQKVVRPKVTTSVDVWSLGAVFSDAFVWSISGEDGREKYRECRRQAIAKLDYIKARGFEACFHNGEDVLEVISQFHGRVLQNKRGNDHISERISNFILSDMLTHADSRVCANTLMARVKRVIKEAEREALEDSSLLPQIPLSHDPGKIPPSTKDTEERTPNPPQPLAMTAPPTRPVPTQPGENATHTPETRVPVPVDVMYERLGIKRSNSPICWVPWNRLRGRRLDRVTDLPGMDSARSKIKDFRGRSQVILIDNFTSMKPHADQVAKIARVISYITKVASKKPTLLFFASDSTKPLKCSTSSQVESAIRNMKLVEGSCSMKICLNNILQAVLPDNKRIKPTSIYVCTDGVWERLNDVKHIIKTSIDRLIEAKEDPSTLMFQFIQFGDNDRGTERLQELDDDCKQEHEQVRYDIVDTKRWDDEVYRIVIGSLTEANDDERCTTPGQSQADKEAR